ncbi:Mth938-like domain-containing protein [Sphingobium agri]|uniref:Mth938-like domain-containing protein n=1 Tax=Sphingobium TaxID=165695 RepID=UPI0028F41F5D|nr:Mth938-like domain-containing protein [Sphingobium agri]
MVTGFSGRGFRVKDDVFPDGLLLTPAKALRWSDAPAPEQLTLAALGDLLTIDPLPEFLLLGTGAGLRQPPRAFVRELENMGIGVEAMDSRAAARAWGVLRAEERWIVAALLPL